MRLTAEGNDTEQMQTTLDQQFDLLKQQVAEYAFTDEDIELEEVVGRLLVKAGKTMATAESCTGGRIAEAIISVPGASKYFI